MHIAVIDFETDPFKFMRVPRPFCCEFLSDDHCEVFWGDDCYKQLHAFLKTVKDKYYIFAHNGGKFDFHFLHSFLENPVKVINSRIVSAKLEHHTLRDSYAILPVPLRDYEKDEFDYSKMERRKRERHKDEILRYLHSDCVNLLKLVSEFIERFGLQLTIGSTAMKQLQALYPSRRLLKKEDDIFRRFYYGGRVQCFETGILSGPWKCFDINSSYPKSMRDFRHPINGAFEVRSKMPDSFDHPFFLRFEGINRGALPTKADDGSLSFEKESGEFYACSHEIEAALELGLIDIERVLECHVATETTSFVEYVDTFYHQKREAKEMGDKAGELFAKLLLNSGYGKYGQNPDNFMDWIISRDPGDFITLEENGYELAAEFPDLDLWSRPSDTGERALYDVSIAASITSASRSLLMHGLAQAERPVYCDTDSIICRDFHGEVDATTLGAWKLEKTADNVAIAGKKLYALYNDSKKCCGSKSEKCTKARKCLAAEKLASKGGTLNLRDIKDICEGKEIIYKQDAPTFSVKSEKVRFTERKFKMTVDG
jgi:hypothetical protein